MRPRNSTSRWFAAAICVLATSGFVAAEEGVVRISATNGTAGVVQMHAPAGGTVQYAASHSATASNNYCYVDATSAQLAFSGYHPQMNYGQFGAAANPYQNAAWSQDAGSSAAAIQFAGFTSGQCAAGGCTPQSACDVCPDCCAPSGSCQQGCDATGGNICGGGCDNNGCYGTGYQRRVTRLFAGAVPQNCCNNQSWAKRWWRGQYLNYHGRNQWLANHLFGWMVPSGCCGQGCPPCGKYQVTYADDPGYADQRDNGQAYGVQEYGVPLSVPLTPTVRQSYNYSWGTPSSRITPLGSYTPQTSVRPLYHQTW